MRSITKGIFLLALPRGLPTCRDMTARVAALIATFHRPREYRRVCSGPANCGSEMTVIVDNAGSDEVRSLANAAECRTRYVVLPRTSAAAPGSSSPPKKRSACPDRR